MENKHDATDLAQMQALSLQSKINMTKQRIEAWYDHWDGDVYVSFSGGKDSTVLKHLVDSMYSDVPAVFVNTGLEYPEIQSFVRDIKAGKYDCFNSDVEILRPEMRFDEVVTKYGYPVVSKEVARKVTECRSATANGNPNNYAARQFNGTYVSKNGKGNAYSIERWKFLLDSQFLISHKCCSVMKKKPAHIYEERTGRKPYIGTQAAESKLRKQNWFRNGCNAFDIERPTSQPLSFWTDQDVLEYILKYDVPYASVYGQIQEVGELEGQMFIAEERKAKLCTSGANRTGCIFCMFGCHLDKLGPDRDKNRFQLLKQTHPKQYAWCIGGGEFNEDGMWIPNKDGLGLGYVLDYIGVPYK